MTDPRTPVLIGVGQVTEKNVPLEKASSQPDLIEQACLKAAEDAGVAREQLDQLDVVAIVRSFRESTRNSPEVICKRLGITQAEQWITPHGGYGPQLLINKYAQEIAEGNIRFALFAGAEAKDTVRRMMKNGQRPQWDEPSDRDPKALYESLPMSTDYEKAYGLELASYCYGVMENALRHHYGESLEDHQMVMGRLFARFSEIATQSPHAWFPQARTAEEIATPGPANRFHGWPYTKLMNAMNNVNQSAAVLMASVEFARELGLDEENFVYLHGCADVRELWHVTDRQNYFSSPAIRLMGEKALEMAGKTIGDIDFLDLYSCFPSAVQIARDELGIAKDDPRDLTITGGLPYHGGAGNNYVMNSIAAMVEKLRENRGKYGLVTANGGFLSKHAAGIYSTEPINGKWQREDPTSYQEQIDNLPHPPVIEEANGAAIVETYTIFFDREEKPVGAIIIGRLGTDITDQAPRFLAAIPPDRSDVLKLMSTEDMIGRIGEVHYSEGRNIFSLS